MDLLEEANEMEDINKMLDQHARRFDLKNKDTEEDEAAGGGRAHEGAPARHAMSSSMPSLPRVHQKLTLAEQNKIFKHPISKNIIIIKGNTITRQEIFKLKDYFDRLSDGKKTIRIKEFTKAFAEKPHMKRVTASLFNFLDS
jgi:hypothetical protein